MRVLFLKEGSNHVSVMWEVHDGPKWWTASWSVAHGGWTIMTGDTFREVLATGRIGQRIISAIEAHKAKQG